MARKRPPARSEVAWAAGIFEGEGSIVLSGRHLRLQVSMTDEDIIRRMADVLGGNVYGPYSYQQPDGHVRKPSWRWHADGSLAHSSARLMEPWLGKRRRARMEALGLLGQQVLDF